VSLNPISSVLKCFLSIVLVARGEPELREEALAVLEEACTTDLKNPQVRVMCNGSTDRISRCPSSHFFAAYPCACSRPARQLHFQRAHVLLAMGRLSDARTALLVVRDLAPREPSVHALLGQVTELPDSISPSNVCPAKLQVCLRLGLKKEALGHLDRAVTLDGKEATALKVMNHAHDGP